MRSEQVMVLARRGLGNATVETLVSEHTAAAGSLLALSVTGWRVEGEGWVGLTEVLAAGVPAVT